VKLATRGHGNWKGVIGYQERLCLLGISEMKSRRKEKKKLPKRTSSPDSKRGREELDGERPRGLWGPGSEEKKRDRFLSWWWVFERKIQTLS